jgi:hypothetical protein
LILNNSEYFQELSKAFERCSIFNVGRYSFYMYFSSHSQLVKLYRRQPQSIFMKIKAFSWKSNGFICFHVVYSIYKQRFSDRRKRHESNKRKTAAHSGRRIVKQYLPVVSIQLNLQNISWLSLLKLPRNFRQHCRY